MHKKMSIVALLSQSVYRKIIVHNGKNGIFNIAHYMPSKILKLHNFPILIAAFSKKKKNKQTENTNTYFFFDTDSRYNDIK